VRDAYLAEAARLLPETASARVKELMKMITGETTGEVALALRLARETGAALPRTARRLHQIIGAVTGGSLRSPRSDAHVLG
jgi:hypothetical protein